MGSMSNAAKNEQVDDVLSVLKHPERRWILKEIVTQSPTNLRRLAHHCAAEDVGGPFDDYRRAHISLQQMHLPMLHDAGAIHYDPDSEDITIEKRFAESLEAAIAELETIHRVISGEAKT